MTVDRFGFIILILGTICTGQLIEAKYNEVLFAGLYERDFYREFTSYMNDQSGNHAGLTDVLDVLNRSKFHLEDVPTVLDGRSCLVCRASVHAILNHYSKSSTVNLDIVLNNLCDLLTSASTNECRGNVAVYLVIVEFCAHIHGPEHDPWLCAVWKYSPTIEFILKEKATMLSSSDVCGILLQQSNCVTNDSFIDFTINANEPVLKNAKEHQFNDTLSNLTIVQLSDFHYDPYYAEGSSSECIGGVCCRNTSQAINNSTAKAGKWGDYNVCDSPGYLIENICEQVAREHKKIDAVYFTGDFLDHFGWNTTKVYVQESLEFVTNTLKNYFPDIPVIPIIGNHDVHPANAFAPASVTNETVGTAWLYKFLAEQWNLWLPESALDTLHRGGYYTLSIRPGWRIIAMNSNPCFTGNLWLLYETQSLKDQLQWLHDTLLAAEENNEKVHILSHVPSNTDSCVKAWDREYKKIVLRFAHIISGQFNGHTHFDEFSIYYAPQSSAPFNIAFNGGSGTAFTALNSNYRIYYVHDKNFEVIDHETWIFNLTEANQHPDQTPRWFKEYSFRELYEVDDLSPSTLHKMLTDWMTERNNGQFIKYWKHKNKHSDVALAEQCHDECLHKLWCSIVICPS